MSSLADALAAGVSSKLQHQFWDSLTPVDQEQVRRVSDLYYKSGQIRDRRYHLVTYKTCFVAREFVEWAVTGSHAKDREHATLLGAQMTNGNIVHHVTDDHNFGDGYLFFRFRVDDVEGPAARTLQEVTVRQGWAEVDYGRTLNKRRYIVLAKTQGTSMSLLCFKTNSSSAPDAVITIGTEGARVVGELAEADRAGFYLTENGSQQPTLMALLEDSQAQQSWIGTMLEAGATNAPDGGDVGTSVYDFAANDIDGIPIHLSDYKGKVLILVNVASN